MGHVTSPPAAEALTDRDLRLIRKALLGMFRDLQDHINSCPDPEDREYAGRIAQYQRRIHRVLEVSGKIDTLIQQRPKEKKNGN